MLQTAHFFFDEQHENLHDIIEADAKTIFPTSNIKNDILTQLISERCYKHLTKESDLSGCFEERLRTLECLTV